MKSSIVDAIEVYTIILGFIILLIFLYIHSLKNHQYYENHQEPVVILMDGEEVEYLRKYTIDNRTGEVVGEDFVPQNF